MKIEHEGHEYKIKWVHVRPHNGNDEILPRGGTTIARTEKSDGTTIERQANCSVKDTYNKKLGRVIATGRLLKALGISTKFALNCH